MVRRRNNSMYLKKSIAKFNEKFSAIAKLSETYCKTQRNYSKRRENTSSFIIEFGNEFSLDLAMCYMKKISSIRKRL